VQRQFENWGLPTSLQPEYLTFAKAWAQWLPRQPEAKREFISNSKSFSYLKYLERDFYPAFGAGRIQALEDERNLAVIIAYFAQTPPDTVLLAQLASGYTLEGPPPRGRQKKGHILTPGAAYVVQGNPPTQADQISHAIVLWAPLAGDLKFEGMFNSFKKGLQKVPHPFPVLEVVGSEAVPSIAEELTKLDAAMQPERKFLVCMLGMQPGSVPFRLTPDVTDF
jgi:hypothetical protein